MMMYTFDDFVTMALDSMPPFLGVIARPMMETLSSEQKAELESQLNDAMDAVQRGDRPALDTILNKYPMLTAIANTAGYDLETVIGQWFARAANNA